MKITKSTGSSKISETNHFESQKIVYTRVFLFTDCSEVYLINPVNAGASYIRVFIFY